eukprot:gene15446-biopygen4547
MLGQARVHHSQRRQPLQPFSTSPAGPVDRSRDLVDSRSAWPLSQPDLPRARRRLRPRRPAPGWFPHLPRLRQCDGRARAPAPPPTAGEGRREPGRDARPRRVQRQGVQWQVSRNGRPVPIRKRRAGLPESPAPDRGRASNATARVMTPCAAWPFQCGIERGLPVRRSGDKPQWEDSEAGSPSVLEACHCTPEPPSRTGTAPAAAGTCQRRSGRGTRPDTMVEPFAIPGAVSTPP